MLEKLKEQNKEYTDAYWDIFDNKEAVPAEQQSRMREELLKNYDREIALLDGQAGLDKERKIAELDYERAKIKEEARLRKAELAEEYRLKHVELKQRTDTQVARMEKEFEIQRRVEKEMLEIKEEQIVPVKLELPKRWWQRLLRRPTRYYTNYAYELAEQKAVLEANSYLNARADEVLKLEAEQSGTDELKYAISKIINENKKKGRKAKKINEALDEIIEPLNEMFARRERALNELLKRLDEGNSAALNEPEEQDQEVAQELSAEAEREELQHKAASMLAAFCEKRIAELQTQKKPKRKRIRKTRPESKEEESDD